MYKVPRRLSVFTGSLPLFDTSDRTAALRCPSCEGDYLHHHGIEVFNPVTEDAKEGVYVAVTDQSVDLRNSGEFLDRNPSDRRNGLIISFTCETCPAITAMTIAQHKGNTYVSMHVVDPKGNNRPD